MIFPDGREVPIFRPSGANIIEQKRVVRAAAQHSAEALVIECMALQPLLQSVCELKLVQSTIGVITNSRADHLDVMGPTRRDVARALAGTTPVKGRLFTAEHRNDCLEVFRAAARDRGSELESLSQFERHRVTAEMLAGFSYLEHAENVALALRVCESVGVDRDVAIQGMWSATPDPGAMRVFRHSACGEDWYFVNAFAANDPESTAGIWETAFDRFPSMRRRIAVMNCRSDRPERSKSMAEASAHWRGVDLFLVTGTGTESFIRPLIAAGVEPDRVIGLGTASAKRIASEIAKLPAERTLIVGMGNIASSGMELADFFERAESSTTSVSTEYSDRYSYDAPIPQPRLSFARAA
jgi:poly-gamma-glutamate synthase PgsB/CapB